MKAEFLKLAGVKSEKAFYKKYPNEAAFFKAHPEAKKMIKKAQWGAATSMVGDYVQGMNNVPNTSTMDPNVSVISQSDLANDQSGYAFKGGPNTNAPQAGSLSKGLETLPGLGGQLIQGFNQLKEEKKARKKSQMWAKVTGVQADAAESQDIDDFRQYSEDMNKKREAFMPVNTGEEFFPIYGVGTNVLARNGARLQDGGMVGGNPTEIQNTYAPEYDIYSDLEYEPLYNVDQIKAYEYGGGIPTAQQGGGFSNWLNTMNGGGSGFSGAAGAAGSGAGGGTPWGMIGQMGSGIVGGATGNNAGGNIGGTIGGAAGAIWGPAGSAIGQIAGKAIGAAIDKNPKRQRLAEGQIKHNQNRMKTAQFTESNKQLLGAYAEHGANINPQIISEFGGNKLSTLLTPPRDAEMLRAGGHLKSYTAPSERAMETYEDGGEVRRSALNGEVQTTWGGGIKTLSHNPYMPGTGETIQFVGNSHDTYDPKSKQTGIGVKYGQGDQDSYTDYAEYGTEQADANVEVEKEPAAELIDPVTGEKNLTVYGNLMIPKYGVDILGDGKAKGKKFKNYVADLSKIEQKQNKIIGKSTEELDSLDVQTSFDKLKMASLEANLKGGNMKLKDIADKKIKAADLQNAINDTAEEYGLIADDLAKGKIKTDKKAMNIKEAMFGTKLTKAQDGGKKLKSVSAMKEAPKGQRKSGIFYGGVTNEDFEKMKDKNSWYNWEDFDPNDSADVLDFQTKFNKLAEASGVDVRLQEDKMFGEQTASADSSYFTNRARSKDFEIPAVNTYATSTPTSNPDNKFEIVKNKKNPWLNLGYQTLKAFLDRPYEEALSPEQLMGEYSALASNKLEPVQAQPYSPQLRVPYEINRNAAKNDLIGQTRATQRLVGYNPAAQAAIAAQAYGPMQELNEQDFIDNQRMKDAVYSGNIATLNDAELKNREIYDQQYVRQEQAKSNTKAVAQAALSSIGDKLAQQARDVRTYNTYKTLFPQYGFNRSGQGKFEGGYADFNIAQMYNPGQNPNYALIKNPDGTFSYKLKEQVKDTDSIYTPPSSFNENDPIYEDDEYSYNLSPLKERDEMLPSKKVGGKVKKNYSQSSIVKAFK